MKIESFVKKILLTIVLFLVLANVEFGDVAQIIGDYYSIDKGKIYYRSEILEGVDYNTFEVFPNGDGKDKNRSYEDLTKDEWKWF